MNERIEKLFDQALEEFKVENEYATIVVPDPLQRDFVEKFAQLIVQECVDKITTYDLVPGHSAKWEDIYDIHIRLLQDLGEELKEHFGVESTSIKVGSRVKVVSGFNVGAKGTVSYIEPTGRMWVMRDGASTDVFYHPEEVIGVEE